MSKLGPDGKSDFHPERISGFKKLPFTVQGILRALGKSKNNKTEKDVQKLKMLTKETDFFKEKNIEDSVLTQIIK